MGVEVSDMEVIKCYTYDSSGYAIARQVSYPIGFTLIWERSSSRSWSFIRREVTNAKTVCYTNQ